MNEKQLFELAVKNGYAKGINEFRAFTGVTPFQYVRSMGRDIEE